MANPAMGALETFVVNSPFRAPFARSEVARFRRTMDLAPGSRLLEIGCGAGITTKAIVQMLEPAHLSAFDFSQDQVSRARRRLRRLPTVDVRQADATAMPYEGGAFDAAIEIGILHHIPEWRRAVGEIARVLRPNGAFCFAEPTKGRLTRGMYRIFPHPPEAMFERDELLGVLADAGLTPAGVGHSLLWNVFGVARRTLPAPPG